jgi:hypothetical protein
MAKGTRVRVRDRMMDSRRGREEKRREAERKGRRERDIR